jgi:hypothetical protein
MEITVYNQTGSNIEVKISSDGIGCDGWFSIGEIDKWTRKPGGYEMSIKFPCFNYQDFSYRVSSPSIIYLTSTGQVFDYESQTIIYPSSSIVASNDSDNQSKKIGIVNHSGTDIYIRISKKDFGSEEFYPIYNGVSDNWIRSPGYTYLMQFAYYPSEDCLSAYVRPGENYLI